MGPFTSGSAREIADPEAEVKRLAAARKPREQLLCHEAFLVDHDGTTFLVWIKVSAEHALQAAEEPKSWPFPVRVDLGPRIADLIRADCAADSQPA